MNVRSVSSSLWSSLLELYYSFYFAIRIVGANIQIVFEYSVLSPSESKQHWLRCRCSRSITSHTNITSGGYRNVSGLTILRIRLINRWNLLYNGLCRNIWAVAAWSKIGRRRTGYEHYTRSAVWSCSKCQRQPASRHFFMNGAPWLCSVGLPTKLAYSVHQTALNLRLAYINKRTARAATRWKQPSSSSSSNNNNNGLAVARRWTRGDDQSKEHLCSLLYSPPLMSNIVYTARR
jgi:hypothetical protein